MTQCVSLCAPGPNVLLLLNRTQRLRSNLRWFGEDAFKHSMVIRTNNLIESLNVNQLLQACGEREYSMLEGDQREEPSSPSMKR